MYYWANLWIDDWWDFGLGWWYKPAQQIRHTPTSFWTWTGWWNWGSVDTSNIQERIERKKTINKKLDEFKNSKNITAKKYIWWKLNLTRNKSIYSITIPNSPDYDDDLNKLNKLYYLWNKYPTSNYADKQKTFIENFVEAECNGRYADFFQNADLPDKEVEDRYYKFIAIINKSFINDKDLEELINLIPPKIKKQIEWRKHWWWWTEHSKVRMKRTPNKINITPKPNKTIKEISLTRWKRINRWYINRTDYRCLVDKRIEKHKKPKILFLLDWSWSMGYWSPNPYPTAMNFLWDISQTHLFDTQMLLTTSADLQDITTDVWKWGKWETNEIWNRIGRGEWFERLTYRSWALERDEDYVVVLTDMEVPQNAEDNLRLFIWWKKHLILSFWTQRQFNNLNVRYVNDFKDIKNSITTLLW